LVCGADDRWDDTAAQLSIGPNPTEALEIAAYLARNLNFESIPLQR